MKSYIQDNHDSASTLNNALVDELKARAAINTPHVEAAFRAVPRHVFVPDVSLEAAYTNRAIPTKLQNGQSISSSSEPTIMVIMLEQLGLQLGHKVLEIGAGTGYNAALMAHIVGQTGAVVTVDIDEEIVASAKAHLAAAGFDRVRVICADGGNGYSDAAPYDRIILTVSASDILPAWREQMNPDGRLLLPLAIREVQKVIAFEQADTHLVSVSVKNGAFMAPQGELVASSPNVVQLGSHANLLVRSMASRSIDGEKVYRWLTSTSSDWDTGIVITAQELFGNLRLWAALHAPDACVLSAHGDMVERGIVPPLVALDGEKKFVSTALLLSDGGMAALMRPPGQPVLFADINNPTASESPFNLYIRQFGVDESPAHRLITMLKSWEEAGRPTAEGLRVRVYPKAARYTPMASALVVDTQWNQLVLEWKAI